jgi:hypothetical protein
VPSSRVLLSLLVLVRNSMLSVVVQATGIAENMKVLDGFVRWQVVFV